MRKAVRVGFACCLLLGVAGMDLVSEATNTQRHSQYRFFYLM